MATKTPLLDLDNITIVAPNREKPGSLPVNVLARQVSLQLEAGCVLPVVGPSGAGKSTLLKTIVRLAPLEEGEIRFQGQAIQNVPPATLRRTIAYLPQTPVMFPGTVRDNLLQAFQYGAVSSPAPSDQKLIQGLAEVGLDVAFLEQRADRLSGGESQRVALLRALLPGPAMLLLDEPTSGLDPESVRYIVDFVKAWVAREHRAALWVAHDQKVVDSLDCSAFYFPPGPDQGIPETQPDPD